MIGLWHWVYHTKHQTLQSTNLPCSVDGSIPTSIFLWDYPVFWHRFWCFKSQKRRACRPEPPASSRKVKICCLVSGSRWRCTNSVNTHLLYMIRVSYMWDILACVCIYIYHYIQSVFPFPGFFLFPTGWFWGLPNWPFPFFFEWFAHP